jgi:hypothetical protein
MLRFAPEYLRVTCDTRKLLPEWDALDQLLDTPEPHESLSVYQRVGTSSLVHIRATKGSGFYRMAQYRLLDRVPCPPEDVLRDNKQWATWMENNRATDS